MNVKSGFRRIALVLAIVGFGIASSAAVRHLEEFRQRSDQHARFTVLASSSTVQGELARIRGGKKFRAKSSITGENRLVYWSGEKPPDGDEIDRIVTGGYPVKAGRIQAIGLNYDGVSSFLQQQSGEKVYDAIPPATSEYCLLALYPVIGFVIPFIAMTTISWVVAGFSRSPK